MTFREYEAHIANAQARYERAMAEADANYRLEMRQAFRAALPLFLFAVIGFAVLGVWVWVS